MLASLGGALLIDKPEGISSFGVIEKLQRSLMERYGVKKRDVPKLGHGGTLDPFATGLLIVCVGRGVKLSRYFLTSVKTYEGTIRFGETTVPGDPTDPISETSPVLPQSIEEIQTIATNLTRQEYLQRPPMHSAKKRDGKPLYELARQGIEVEREPKSCRLFQFDIQNFENARSRFHVVCSPGTYIRTLSQDLGRLLGTVAMLDSLRRVGSGRFTLQESLDLKTVLETNRPWDELSCWVPFDQMLEGYGQADATSEEALALFQGRQNVLFNILKRAQPKNDCLPIYQHNQLIAIARRENDAWGLERVFLPEGFGEDLNESLE